VTAASVRGPAAAKIARRALGVAALFAAAAAVDAQPMAEDLDTPFVITPTNVVTAMLDLAGVKAGDRLIDLGSGDGRIVLAAALRGATGVGIEIDGRLVERSRASAKRMGLDGRATFVTQDLFESDFSGADVVTLYLLPDVNKRLAPKFLATLKPGTRIVSHDYGLGDWPPDRTIVVDAPDKPVNVEKKSTLMFWRVPAQVDGRWQGEAGGRPLSIEFRQRYQQVSGTARWSGHRYRFSDQRVDGDRMVLRLTEAKGLPLQVELRAAGDRLAGELREPGQPPLAVAARR
jgi:SAM-dependent methyltransferase